jgi:anti-sigma B factor antagonist
MSEPTAQLSGEWTIHVIAQHKAHIQQLVEEGSFELDVANVTDMDSAGLQLLISARRSLEKQGRELRLSRASPAIKQVLLSYGLDENLHTVQGEGITP